MSIAAQQNKNMILGQILTNDVLDPTILNAISATPRERFLPDALAGSAFVDGDLPLGNGRFLIAPLECARMVQRAEITPECNVLIVGGSNGYSAALVSKLAKQVVLCEADDALLAKAQACVAALGIINVSVQKVDCLSEGASALAPYDVILIEGAAERIPLAFNTLLKEGGRLIAAERIAQGGLTQGLARIVEYKKLDGALFRKEWTDTALPLLPGFEAKAEFVF